MKLWHKRIRRALLATLVSVLLVQWAYPDSYFAAYEYVRIAATKGQRRRGTKILQCEFRERSLVAVGYEYGLAVRRFYHEKRSTREVCLELSFADRDLSDAGLDVEYFNAKLRGLGDVRAACAEGKN